MTNTTTTNLAALPTEARNPRSERIDELSTVEMLSVINDEDATVAAAVRTQMTAIAAAVDAISARFESGGRLFYMGAGTSGRLGVLDASECPPTFSVDPGLFCGLIAGGDSALRRSSEGSEDSAAEGERDLKAAGFAAGDTLVGIAASGRTPYVLGALDYANQIGAANQLGALTVALTCVRGSAMGKVAEIAIEVETGPEVLTGSTRMKAGTATKMVLNMLSTGVMIRTGAVFGNLMVNVQTTNAKLVDRGRRIVAAATGCDMETAARLLSEAGTVKTAIVMQRGGLNRSAADAALAAAHGVLRKALPR